MQLGRNLDCGGLDQGLLRNIHHLVDGMRMWYGRGGNGEFGFLIGVFLFSTGLHVIWDTALLFPALGHPCPRDDAVVVSSQLSFQAAFVRM
jgi:hypothetical protein